MGNLLEQYENSQKNKKTSKTPKASISQQEFIVFKEKKPILKNSKKDSKQLKLVKEESPQQNSTPSPKSDDEQTQQIMQPIPIAQPPSIVKSKSANLKKILLKDIGNIDQEIQKLTRETKDFEMDKLANKSQFSYQSSSTNNVAARNNPRQNSSSQQQQSKGFNESRQRPSSKESHISDSSYQKKVEFFKGVVRSQSLKKLPQQQQQYKFSQQIKGSEKKNNQSVNRTVTIESENKEPSTNKISQSERKTQRPTINRSQTKQYSPLVEKKSTPIKTMLKVQFNSILVGSNSTKNKSSSSACFNKQQDFHHHKESYNSQVNLQQNECVEAQIEEAVQLYKNLKSLMQSKSTVLQIRKDGNQIPRKTADFFQYKEVAKPTQF
ncbi:unnamed protein product (macronuclear) [Paramecium tetraurelia]|uniref:Uncharacterized protein n=1 Tax=Paramecium tetraurelia TaxID=5888 RepID=A0DV78_PARTE|nr:uncharacterized protein GSPATT00020609001 [Paramecium tetraurelia]CAK86945.1 unnamed protein product [Paramecium tetraurelia]|eukprot:XP_001454342.1 hypothetical protein (macronuclear) [Paramecium tetraurelia strain d4-2]